MTTPLLRKFDEHLQILGVQMAPIAWDLAKMKWESDADRYAVLSDMVNGEKKS